MKQPLRRGLLVVLLILAFVLATYLYSRIASPWNAVAIEVLDLPSANKPHEETLRIGAYNIAHGRGPAPGSSNWERGSGEEHLRRLQSIGQLLKSNRLDIVVLNEVDFSTVWSGHVDQSRIIAESAGLKYIAKQRNLDVALPFVRWRFGNAVLSRFPIKAVEEVSFPPYSQWENLTVGNHDSIRVRTELPDGKKITVWGVHLEVRSEATRIEAARQIVAFARTSDEPLLVLGDFNSTPSHAPGATPHQNQTALDLIIASKLFQVSPNPAEPTFTFPSESPHRAIDWILAKNRGSILSNWVPSSLLSDHLPVCLKMEFD